MRADLSTIDEGLFFVRPTHLDGIGEVVQVSPRAQKHRWAPAERMLRSLLCRPDGTIVSSGFPKFFNYGEDADEDARTRAAVEAGSAWFTEKRDGSLLIRDVIDGVVNLRTRGAPTLLDNGLGERIRALVAARYPALLDPAVLPGRSLLLEYTSDHPDDRIIVQYDERALTALGWMDLCAEVGPPRFHGGPAELAEMADQTGAPAVPLRRLPPSMEGVIDAVQSWDDVEGVVIRAPLAEGAGGGLHLSKLKSLRYLRSHTVRYHFSPKRLARFCWAEDVRDLETLQAALHARGVDWEVLAYLRPSFDAHRAAVQAAEAAVDGFLAAVDAAGLSADTMGASVRVLKAMCAAEPAWADLFGLGVAAVKGDDRAGCRERFIGARALGSKPNYAEALRSDPAARAVVLDVTPGLSAASGSGDE